MTLLMPKQGKGAKEKAIVLQVELVITKGKGKSLSNS